MGEFFHEDEEEDEEAEGEIEVFSPSHLPFAPSSEINDSTTTIDPSYIIHLIRQLVPFPIQGADGTADSGHTRESLNCSNSHPFKCALEESNKSPKLQLDSEDDTTASCSMEKSNKCSDQVEDSISNGSTLTHLWEESGCILWDLSTDKSHAELMVDNFLLDVILANISLPIAVRKMEICLGILANLACHEVPRRFMISTKGLIDAVMGQLFTSDSPCLYEAFRLLTSVLQNDGTASWVHALTGDHVLHQILYISGNTLNQKLLEKSIEFILSIVDSQQVATVLLPSLMHSGLPSLLIDLLESEMMQISTNNTYGSSFSLIVRILMDSAFTTKFAAFDTQPLTGTWTKDNILDMILRVCEGISLVDNYASILFANKKIFHYACALVKHADKDEISSSCVTAVVLVANLISDEPDLADTISKDLLFMNGLLDVLSSVLDNSEASNAFWSLFARLVIRVPELMSTSSAEISQLVSLFVGKSFLIAEAIENHVQDAKEDISKKSSTAMTAFLQGAIVLLEQYMSEYFRHQVPGDVVKAHKLFKEAYDRKRSCA